jgi:hypothetical protein
MTSSPDVDPIAAIKASPIQFCLYREAHKGLRHALFQLTVGVGSADCTNADARAAVVDDVQNVLAVLNAHHEHEDVFIKPLIEAHAPELASIVDTGHMEIEADLLEIEVLADKLAGCAGGAAVVAGLELYAYLCLFTASYLSHLALEEGGVMITLRAKVGLEELFGVLVALLSSMSPSTMCAFLRVTMPALNAEERASLLRGMRAAAPPDVFDLFRSAAEAALGPEDHGVAT